MTLMTIPVDRWTATAASLGEPGIGLRLELQHLAAEPSPNRIARAIASAFWTAEYHRSPEVLELVTELQEALQTA